MNVLVSPWNSRQSIFSLRTPVMSATVSLATSGSLLVRLRWARNILRASDIVRLRAMPVSRFHMCPWSPSMRLCSDGGYGPLWSISKS